MAWLKTVGCQCPECGPDPCTPGCPCNVSEIHSGGNEGFDQTFDLNSSGHPLGAAASLDVDYDFDVVVSDQIQVYIDGVLEYDSGCVLGTGGTTIALPAGAETVRVVITAQCAGSGDTEWSFSLACS